MIDVGQDIATQLTREGFAVVPNAIRPELFEQCMAVAERDAEQVPIDPNGGLPWAYDVFPQDYVILMANAVDVMASIGADSTIARVTMIKKAAGEPRRYWHNDEATWMAKPDGITPPVDVLALYYLTPTFKDNGCLVVRPGFAPGPHHNAHNREAMPDEIHVPVELGDVVLMDPRTQHASLENRTSMDRLLIRLWTENVWK